MDAVELSQLTGQISAAQDAAKDVENELFRMQTQLLSLLKKYEGRSPRIGLSKVEEEDDQAIYVIDPRDSNNQLSSYNSSLSIDDIPSSDFTGHQDRTARLDDSEDEPDGLHHINSLEVAKQNDLKKTQQNVFKRHGLLDQFAQRYSTTKESPKEVSDESGDESFRTPSSSYSDLLSSGDSNQQPSGDSNQQPIIEEVDTEVKDITDTGHVEADSCGDVEEGEVLHQAELFITAPELLPESEQRVLPPLNLPPIYSPPKTSDRDRIDSSDSEPFTIVPSAQRTPRIDPGPPAQASTPHHHHNESPRRTISHPASSLTTPVDMPGRGCETLPADSSISSCPMCNLSFEDDHDTSYRNFHANACIDRVLGQ